MHQIKVTSIIAADRQRTFAALSDHEQFLSGGGLKCQLVRTGDSEPNGLGAQRLVDAGNMIFSEDIVAFDRPNSYQYKITEMGGWLGRLLHLQHEFGRLELTETTGGTQIDWSTRFRIGIPFLGWILEPLMGAGLKSSFSKLLDRANRNLVANN